MSASLYLYSFPPILPMWILIGELKTRVLKVEIKSAFNILAFNIIMKMLTGNRYFEDDDLNSDETRHRLDDIKQTFSPSRQVGLGGFPFLRWSIIIDTMLSLQELEPEFYTDDIIKGMIMYHILIHCVMNETLRLGPVGQFIPPRDASDDCVIEVSTSHEERCCWWILGPCTRTPSCGKIPQCSSQKDLKGPNLRRAGEKYMIMKETWFRFLSVSSSLFLIVLSKLFYHKQSRGRKLPPSPPSFPIIGHLHLLKEPVHRSLQHLSDQYGPVLTLQFGFRTVLLLSSPSAVEECFTKHDQVFANRPRLLAGKHLHYDYTTLGVAPYGQHWRNLRRLTTLEIFSTNRLNMFLGIRQDEVKFLLRNLFQRSGQGFAREASRFRDIIKEILETSGASNAGDFLPFLQWQERGKTKTFVDSMLALQNSEPEYYADHIIKGMILTLLTAGTDTSAVTMEWAMSLLLNHPTVLDKVKTELDCKIGHQRLVEEPDLSDLPYLRAIVNETLRLFPAAPLLVAHESSDDCSIGGYDVRGGTMLLVNAWAIHRDAKVWEDPTTLVQCFEWQRVGEVEVDMSEGKGLTMPKAQPLEAMCRARNSMIKVLSEL
ncbi:unnamed protein product, partial [Vitis vinifera]